ncbi:MAG: polysaccharide deacetylase family protein [Gaiellaceae bacterium]
MRLNTHAIAGLAAGAVAAALVVPNALGTERVGRGDAPRLTGPAYGAALRGTVPISAEADPLAEWVLFEASTDGGGGWKPIARDGNPLDGWGAEWSTGTFTGRAVIRATDSLGGRTHVRIRVDNAPPALHLRSVLRSFSPNGDGIRELAELRFSADEAVTVTIQVVGPGGRVVQTEARDLYLTSRKLRRFLWDGFIYDGLRRGRDGVYTVRALAADAVGNRSVQTTQVVLDTRAPVVTWRSLTPDRLESGPVRIGLDVTDLGELVRVTPALYDSTGKRVRAFPAVQRRPGALEVAVDAGDPGALAPGGYEIGVLVRDAAGNTGQSTRRSLLVVHAVDAHVWARSERARMRVALTFDDCFQGSAWASILDTLARYRVKATFFCPGQAVLANREVALRTVREGHSIGAHGWDHANFGTLSYGPALQRLVDDREVWWRLAKVSPLPFFRPPYGNYNATTVAAAGAAGYSALVLWDVDPLDWQGPGAGVIEERVVSGTRSGSIDLMHTVSQTASALPSIITRLRARGFKLVSLPALYAAGTPTNGYWQDY